jgi:hypothetical protein
VRASVGSGLAGALASAGLVGVVAGRLARPVLLAGGTGSVVAGWAFAGAAALVSAAWPALVGAAVWCPFAWAGLIGAPDLRVARFGLVGGA